METPMAIPKAMMIQKPAWEGLQVILEYIPK
jgi:hypothetical protein